MVQDRKERGPEQEDRWVIAQEQNLLGEVWGLAAAGCKEGLEEGSQIRPNQRIRMPRPCKRRMVEGEPGSSYFKPAGIRIIDLEESVLAVDEFEAVRLKDLEGLEQEESAKKMNISQPTFHRLILSARKKIADAIVNGKAIRIEGGNFVLREGIRGHRRRHGRPYE